VEVDGRPGDGVETNFGRGGIAHGDLLQAGDADRTARSECCAFFARVGKSGM
jgi:hypothetical protein